MLISFRGKESIYPGAAIDRFCFIPCWIPQIDNPQRLGFVFFNRWFETKQRWRQSWICHSRHIYTEEDESLLMNRLICFSHLSANAGGDSSSGEARSTLSLPLPSSKTIDESPAAPDMGQSEGEGEEEALLSSLASPSRTSTSSFLSLETLACESFIDPGSSTIPFAYPPKREGEEMSCT